MTEIADPLRFPKDSFCAFAIQFFKQSGHTFSTKAVASNYTIKDFIYSVYKPKHVISLEDWAYLDHVKEISWLFSNGKQFFDNPKVLSSIEYFAIDLFVSDNERSQIADGIHRTIAKLALSPHNVILFRADQNYMLSWAFRTDSTTSVFLSDWFSDDDIMANSILEQIDASQFSNRSAIEFHLDFIYSFARRYYIRHESWEYVHYGLFRKDYLDQYDVEVVRQAFFKQIAEENYISPKDQYQNDYVDAEYQEQEEQWFNTDDIDLLLFELDREMEGFSDPDAEEPYDEVDEQDEEIYKDENLGDVDSEIFNDPIKMLKWLEQNSRGGKC